MNRRETTGRCGRVTHHDESVHSLIHLKARGVNQTIVCRLTDVDLAGWSKENKGQNIINNISLATASLDIERRKEMFYLTTHSTHFIYGYMASDIW